ncbi:hypothetical protein ACIQFZ_42245 [Streptomyces sp. NPDC093064]
MVAPRAHALSEGRYEGQATAWDVRETPALRTVALSAVINLTSSVLNS